MVVSVNFEVFLRLMHQQLNNANKFNSVDTNGKYTSQLFFLTLITLKINY